MVLIPYVSAPPELTDITWFMTMRGGFRRAFNFNLDPAKYWISIKHQAGVKSELSVHNMHSITKLNLNCPSYCHHSDIPPATRDNLLFADLDSTARALCISNSEFIFGLRMWGWLCWHTSPTSNNCRILTEIQLELLFAELQVTRTTLLKLARINIGSKFNSKFNIPILQCNEIFSQDWHSTSPSHISISCSLHSLASCSASSFTQHQRSLTA